MNNLTKKIKKEIAGKEFTLLELDNLVGTELGSTTSLFDYTECLENCSCTYYITEDLQISVDWEVLEANENAFETKVKITDVWEI